MGKIKPQALLQQSKKKKGPARISISATISCSLVLVLVLLSLYSAYKHFYKRTQFETEINASEMFGTGGGKRSMKFELPTYATLNTTVGSISLELDKDVEPVVVDQFLKLCKDGQFEGARFYPVINNRVFQIGKIQKFGLAKEWMPKTKYDISHSRRFKYEVFDLVTRKASEEHTQGFELFISKSTISDLDKFAVFGKVLDGDAIQIFELGEDDMKKTDVSILRCLLGSRASA